MKDLVLIGGGHAHAYVIKKFGMAPLEGVRVTLITRDIDTPYSGMLPGHVAGAYNKKECHIDLQRLGRFAKATIIHKEATHIDTKAKVVHVGDGRPPVPYDVLSINLGSTPITRDFSDAKVPITAVKPIDGFSARWPRIVDRVLKATANVTVAVVGAGAGGVELALSMLEHLRSALAVHGMPSTRVGMVIVGRAATVMPSHNALVQESFANILDSRGVQTVLGAAVVAVKDKLLVCDDGRTVRADEVVWCTQAGTQSWLKDTGLAMQDGFLSVASTYEVANTPGVFAAGDCAVMVDQWRPRAGVFAVRAGPPLANNLRATLLGEPLEHHTPQTAFLGIIGTGSPGLAVASKGPMCVEGPWLWELKDYIDRKWMASYTTALPDMGEPETEIPRVAAASGAEAIAVLKHAAMRCGGCGSKVGASVLSRVLKKLKLPPPRPEVIVGLDSPDDCAMVRAPPGMAVVHTVDFFRQFLADPYMFGAIAANHALSDCHAMGAVPATALAIAVVPYGMEAQVENTLLQMMSGAVTMLKGMKCTLVGGHTCEGTELALGFAINGWVDPEKAMRKSGLKPGDTLILTKPVGTGAIMAADMRVKAEGAWVSSAVSCMAQPNNLAAAILRKHGAKACTDVTGFGLIGHLGEMASASDVSVGLHMDRIPTLMGAQTCVEAGIMSSLQPQNVRLKRLLENQEEAAKHPLYPLLFDPQTAGGLLAGVPKAAAPAALAELRAAGYSMAHLVGHVMPYRPGKPTGTVVAHSIAMGFGGQAKEPE